MRRIGWFIILPFVGVLLIGVGVETDLVASHHKILQVKIKRAGSLSAGKGNGAVKIYPPGTICTKTCKKLYASGTMVTLTAMPDAGSAFSVWSGACTGSGPCVVTVSRSMVVTAKFVKQPPPPPNVAPVANAGLDQNVLVGLPVVLDGSASSDADGNPLTYNWSFTSIPLGSTTVLSDATGISPTFTADVGGVYVVGLVVNDSAVNSAADTVMITVNVAPVANAGLDQNVPVGLLVMLDGSASSDADGNSLIYNWSFTSIPSESVAVLSDATGISPTFIADVIGIYVVSLVSNDGAVDSTADTVAITAEFPVDMFGVRMLYPTTSNGRTWSLAADPYSDGQFTTPFNTSTAPISQNSDGSWRISRETTATSTGVRMNVTTPAGFVNWLNVEMTGYVQLISFSFNESFKWRTTSGFPHNNPCDGYAYYGIIRFDGTLGSIAKEVWHNGGYVTHPDSVANPTSALQNRWIGFKTIRYNTADNTHVRLETWIDENADGTWRKLLDSTDTGWATANPFPTPCTNPLTGLPKTLDVIMTWPYPLVTFRADNATFDFKWLSVREITPP